ncbi:LysR substrate-binding domain-containing protein [Streptomyces sp. HC307]|uniref:LysR substrate-binding domain-containing protein n=1 Tax=Streptomyces flavusporus TaxID=3385496 RepID=UPI003916DB09
MDHETLADRLVVGTTDAEAATPHTRATLQALLERNPHMSVELRNLNFVDHIAALQRREVDVVFLRPPVPDGIKLCHLATERRVACLAADVRLLLRLQPGRQRRRRQADPDADTPIATAPAQ